MLPDAKNVYLHPRSFLRVIKVHVNFLLQLLMDPKVQA